MKIRDAGDYECYDESDGTFTISGCGPVEIVTETLSEGMKACAYRELLTAEGGVLPYTWSLLSDGLPTGLDLDGSTGIISGIPDSSGTFYIKVNVEDHEGETDSKDYNLVIADFTGMKGDVSGNGLINILDAIRAVNILLGEYNPTPEEFCAADCNGTKCYGDGEVNILDVLMIINLLLGSVVCP